MGNVKVSGAWVYAAHDIINEDSVIAALNGANAAGKLKLAKLIKRLDKLVAELEAKRLALVEKYAEKDDDGNPIMSSDGVSAVVSSGFHVELGELLKSQHEMPLIKSNVIANLDLPMDFFIVLGDVFID